MITTNLKQVLRRVSSQPLFSGIKYLGLTIGIVCIIIIAVWVQNELGFDRFHQNSENIYRVIMDMGEHGDLALTPPPLIDKIQNDFPEIESATRVEDLPKMVVKNNDIVFYEENGIFADPGFFDVFSFNLLSGNEDNILDEPFSVVITEQFAQKYFGDKDVLNKNLIIRGYPFEITGVLENIPQNSHLQFDFILPIQLKTSLGYDLNDWGDVNLYTYIKLKKTVDANNLSAKIESWETPREEAFFLQPLIDIHGDIHYVADNAKTSDRLYIFVFSSVAVLILIIACLNYITLFITASYKRSKEIGVMKIIGAAREKLMGLFITETALFILTSLFTSLLLVELLLPLFNQATGTILSFGFFHTGTLQLIIILSLVLLFAIGIYPAFHLSALKPQSIFKKEKIGSGIITRSKNLMILVQFSITTILITGLLTVSKQLSFIENKDLGFNKENVVYLPYGGIDGHYLSFKEEILKNNAVLNVSIKNSLPVNVADKTSSIEWPGKSAEDDVLMEATAVGFDYFQTMGIIIDKGRDFSRTIASDKNGVVLNEEAVREMGLHDPIGKTIRVWDYPCTIVGVSENALFYSLKENIGPQIYYMVQDYDDESMNNEGTILLKIDGSNIEQTLTEIKSTWAQFAPDSPFDFHFLDQAVDNKYHAEKKMFALLKYFVLISILISCLGLFGSAVYSTQSRVKEIGVRKVNGANITGVVIMLNKDFIKWVIISLVLAIPVSYYAMYKWLENFAYKTSLSWWIFAIAGVLALGIALLTVSWQSWQAATRNPVQALRYE